ncbi:hypothetical protein [Kribbella sp. NPDC055071]
MRARLERCLTGRLRDTYPPSEHDLEVRLDRTDPAQAVTATLGSVIRQVEHEHPECRRLVFAAPEEAHDVIAAAVEAGFRYVVDVDVDGESLSLMVAEPSWVTAVDMDLDRVPQT